uniref:LAC1 n=1 Tax=Arundo donax TaxID=35708 RepID=A0A0A9GQA0_ARUDO
MWSMSRATPSWPVSFPPSPTRSPLTAKPVSSTSAQMRRLRWTWSPTRTCCSG